MSTIIVGLFGSDAEVQRVTDELTNHGFAQYEVLAAVDTRADLHEWLVDQGVPARDAEDYVVGIRNGGSLVVLEERDEKAPEAVAILRRHERGGRGTAEATATPVGDAVTPPKGRDDPRARHAPTVRDEPEPRPRDDLVADEERFAVVQEELDVGTREVERGGVRVRSHVTEHPVEQDVRVEHERVDVERRPADRPVPDAELDDAFRERSVTMTEHDEEVVVGKRARVVEEVVLAKSVEGRTEHVRDRVRRTDVEVERTDDLLAADRAHYLGHHRDTFGGSEADYPDREVAYRYGIDLAHHPDYVGLDWAEVAPRAQGHWTHQNGDTWGDYEPAVRYAYERAAGRPPG
jgi:uncharacterized protein (TIGR02271 family)